MATKAWDWGDPPSFGGVCSGACEIFLCQGGQGGRGNGGLRMTFGPDGDETADKGVWMSIWVDDVDAVHEHCLEQGLDIAWPPTDMPWGFERCMCVIQMATSYESVRALVRRRSAPTPDAWVGCWPSASPRSRCRDRRSGGVQGFYEKLECLNDPGQEEYERTKTWIESMSGGPFDPDAFDPDAFDLDTVNRALRAIR